MPRLIAGMIDILRRDVIDSLQLEQFTNNLTLNSHYNFGNENNRYIVSASYSHQTINQAQANEIVGNNNTESISPSLSFRYSNKDSGWGYRANFNYNDFQNISVSSQRMGFTLGVDKKFGDKLSLNASGTYFETQLDGERGGNTLRAGLRGNYNLAESHGLNFSCNFIRRNSSNERVQAFSEFLANINYTFTF